MEIRILESARDDLRNAWKFYDRNRAGLGDYFLDCVQADVSSLLLFAGIHEVSEDYHRMLVKRFPFAVYYLIEMSSLISTLFWIVDVNRNGLLSG